MNFFDSTPIGRILNRFSKDQSSIDEYLAPILSDVGGCGIVTLSVVILICVLTPALVVPMGVITILYYFVQKYYKKTARELKQMDSVSKSPIYSYFSESANGSTTIRSYRMQEAFRAEFIQRIDQNVIAFYWHFAVNRW
jgi:ABC-type multidrug transport system fused ATPase/permease subunit